MILYPFVMEARRGSLKKATLCLMDRLLDAFGRSILDIIIRLGPIGRSGRRVSPSLPALSRPTSSKTCCSKASNEC